ncbi:MAG: NAD-dependent malic enzyme [Legionellales bacterium]|nr:NAD-dependent malic enzyme [Legionellales bacterium]
MLDFKLVKDKSSGKEHIETSLSGKPLLTTPQLNKGTAFTEDERLAFGLLGKLPAKVETLEEQVQRAYTQFHTYKNNLKRNIYLNELHDSNQVLFYRLVTEHLAEMIPTIYTPIVGTAVKEFSLEFRHPRGLYLSYPEREHMEDVLKNRSNPEIDLIVVTDGEGVLGIGDQGVGGMDIPIAKLMVYALCGGIDPTRTLPIQLDVGTNNEKLLEDPMYLGWRHERLQGKEYDDFIKQFVSTVKQLFPNVFLHWEDFGRANARRNLETYRKDICTFNDDMQGTGVVTLSSILAGVNVNKSTIDQQRVVVFGAGTAGTGIADQIRDAMCHEGLSLDEANSRFWLLDRPGLLLTTTEGLTDFQKCYAHDPQTISHWNVDDSNNIGLADVVRNVKPTILIGCSAVTGAFTQEIIQDMAAHVERPIILPLSNPTERCEAQPKDLLAWTDGKALIATGSPFDTVNYDGRDIRIAQCNNALVFPGIGLGLIATQAKTLSDESLWIACKALSDYAPIKRDPMAPLLPSLDEARKVARHIAIAVGNQVRKEGVDQAERDCSVEELVDHMVWQPHYVPLVRRQAT